MRRQSWAAHSDQRGERASRGRGQTRALIIKSKGGRSRDGGSDVIAVADDGGRDAHRGPDGVAAERGGAFQDATRSESRPGNHDPIGRDQQGGKAGRGSVSYTHLRAHET